MPEHILLAEHVWLPVVRRGGQREFARLCDISRPDIVGVSTGRPDCDISLTEFLIGMLSVVCGPTDEDDWKERFLSPPSAEALQAAFQPFASALTLDGDGPRFFQDNAPLDGAAVPIAGLLIDAPGNAAKRDNADHFVKRGQTETLSRIGAAIVLLTLQTSAPAGGAGHRTSLRGGGPLSTIIVPGGKSGAEPTLWQRLWANVPVEFDEAAKVDQRLLPWLGATRVSDAGVVTTPRDVHPAQAFFGLPRRIRLVFEPNLDRRPCDLFGLVDDVVVRSYVTRPWGTNYEGWGKGHPLSPYYRPKATDAEWLPVHLQSSRVGYREWLGFAWGANDLRVPAACVHAFKKMAVNFTGEDAEIRSTARLLVAGYAMDNMKPLDFGEALMPLIVASSTEANLATKSIAQKLVDASQVVSSQLTTSVKIGLYGDGAKAGGDSAVLRPVRDRFWAETELSFFDAIRNAAERMDEARDALQDKSGPIEVEIADLWRQVIGRHALLIFDETVPLENAAAKRMKDVIKARRLLLMMLSGHSKGGDALFKALGIQVPDKKTKNSKKGRTGT